MNLSKIERKTRERFPGLSEKSEEKATGNTHGASIGAEWMIPRAICSFFQKFLLSRISDIT